MNSYDLFKSIAFSCDPETIHHTSISLLSRFPSLMYALSPRYESARDLSVKLNCGLTFRYPIGLAAGLDKNAECITYFSKLPFGAIEVGTVTPKPQAGNPKPRLFRLIEQESLLNRMGFNNAGMDQVYQNLAPSSVPVGLNLGKNKTTSEKDAALDYQVLYRKFAPVSDYLVVNVSSPNTPGLRDLQKVDALSEIFSALKDERVICDKPLFLKISPDMSLDDIEPIIKLAHDEKLAGLIATNTTIDSNIGVGGVSGKLIKEKSKIMREHVLQVIGSGSPLDVIGVGGVDCYEELKEFWRLGGKVMQIYTSFIYQGPAVLHHIYRAIEDDMSNHGVSSVGELRDVIS
jgi:dihydroorotate dehydrogenase